MNIKVREAEEALERARIVHANYPSHQSDMAVRRAEKDLAELENDKPKD